MKRIRLLALIMAVVAAGAIFLYIKTLGTGKQEEAPKSNVVVAVVDIALNATITEDMVTVKSVPTEEVLSNTYTDASLIIGKTTSAKIFAGEQIVSSRLVTIGSADTDKLSYSIEPGMRAITLGANEISSVDYMIKPGDHIDIIAQYEVEREVIKSDGQTEQKTIPEAIILLQNVKVLAVDQILQESGAVTFMTLTLEVTPQQAVKLSFSENTGVLRAILRSPLDTDEATTDNITIADIITD